MGDDSKMQHTLLCYTQEEHCHQLTQTQLQNFLIKMFTLTIFKSLYLYQIRIIKYRTISDR